MPAKSRAQYKLMAMVANNPSRARELGISQSVGKEFVDKTPASDRSRWSKKKKKNGMDKYGD